jgi:thiol-disulfide isomerase/thioredoxin
MKKFSIFLIAIVLAGCGTTPKDVAINLAGPTLTGESFQLENGRAAVVNVWASWCAPCRAEAPTLVALAKQYPEVQFVGILTRDNEATANAFVDRFKINYPTIVDDTLLLKFRSVAPANAIPSTIVLGKDHKVVGSISGQVTVAKLRKLIEATQ